MWVENHRLDYNSSGWWGLQFQYTLCMAVCTTQCSLSLFPDRLSRRDEFLAESSCCSGLSVVGHVAAVPAAAIHSPGQHGAIPRSSKNGSDGHPSSSHSYHQCVHSHRTATRGPSTLLQRSFACRWSWTTDIAKVTSDNLFKTMSTWHAL